MHDKHLEDVLSRRALDGDRDSATEWMLPVAGSEYQAFGKPASTPLCSLHFGLGKAGYRSFQYMHLDSDSSFGVDGKGHVIVVRFAGIKPVAITIRGRNLSKLYSNLHEHRTPWIMRADRDFGDDDAPIVTAIEFTEVKETEPGRSQDGP
jgi:hypothetical protein